MRNFVFFLFLVVTAAFLAACSRGEPQIVVETLQFDFGDVPNGEIAARDVRVRNGGDAVLVVEGISTSCGCTSATLAPMRLAPGEQGTLHIEYDAGAHGPDLTGPLVRQVFINSNDPAQPEVTVELAVNITPRQLSEGN
ncbi:MAG: DUF1573 domain-containing protein [Anaerolineae bacterium]|nr:DUF1573 domain-containing protein [Anaerolineae bacterium]